MPKCYVLVEPIFDNGKLPEEIKKITKDLIGVVEKVRSNDIAEHLITASSLTSKFSLGIQAVSTDEDLIGRTLKIKIEKIKIYDENNRFEFTFGDTVEVEIKVFKAKTKNSGNNGCSSIDLNKSFGDISKSEKVGDFSVVFPSPGLYWLELEVESLDKNIKIEIETAQRQLNNRPGTGWSKEDKKYFLKQPILVVDSSAMYQAKINKTILFLTLAMLALTAFAEIVDPLKIHILIKLTAIFGSLIFKSKILGQKLIIF